MPIDITSHTCWILGAGASYDCIAPGRTCVPITRNLIAPSNLSPEVLDALVRVLRLAPERRHEEVRVALAERLEVTFDVVRGQVASADSEVSAAAARLLEALTDIVADRIRGEQIEATLAYGATRGFVFCAENYLWLASRSCHFPHWSIVTLNYDGVLDRAYEELAVRSFPVPPFEAWSSMLSDHLAGRAWEERDDGIYIKLHGSLELYSCLRADCARYRRPFSARPSVRPGSLGIVENVGQALRPMCAACGRPSHELILPPGENKIDAEWSYHRLMYRQAARALATAASWVIVGYSCPDYDTDTLALLESAACAPLPGSWERQIAVVSPDAPEVALRLSRHINHPVRGISRTFSQFVDDLHKLEGAERPGLA